MSSVTAPRKPAPRLPRPAARYWKGKVPKGAEELPSEDESDYAEEEERQVGEEAGDVAIEEVEEEEDRRLEVRKPEVKRERVVKGMNVALRDVNISKEGRVIVAGKEEVGRTEIEQEEETEEEEEEEETEVKAEEVSEYETESEEEESEEEPPKLQFRPVFVPKRTRATVAEKETLAQDTEEALKRKEQEAEERRKESHNLVAESIRRELLEKEKEAEAPDVDDTDGLNPEEEFEAWRLRELARIKRDKEQAMARELEREEIERRRALPEEQRLKEDLERAEQTRAEKPKGAQKFLQKYWHKGAFHQDEEILRKHDYTEATESTVDVSVLPKVMQVKNFGKRGRTKYTHLLDQDTTVGTGGFGGAASIKAGGTSTTGGGCFVCGGPHLKKDCPQARETPGKPGTGANASGAAIVGSRQWGAKGDDRERGTSWRDRDRDRVDDRRERYDSRRDGRGDDRRDDRRRDDRERDRGWDRSRGARDQRYDDRDRYERRRSRSRSRSLSPRRDAWRQREDNKDSRRYRERRRSKSRQRSPEYGREEKRRRIAVS